MCWVRGYRGEIYGKVIVTCNLNPPELEAAMIRALEGGHHMGQLGEAR